MLCVRSALLAMLGLAVGWNSAAGQLNVLLITADDLGVQLGCYGDTAAETPNLDALASRGVLFEHAYVAQASCSPSRSAMFTGLYPHTNGQYGLLNANVGFGLKAKYQGQVIPNLLKSSGYRTGIVGKLHVGTESEFEFDTRIRVDTRDVKLVAEKAKEFFLGGKEPFFLMANYSDPHVYGQRMQPRPKETFPTQYKGVPENPIPLGKVPPLPFQRLNEPEEVLRTTQYYNAAKRFDAGVGMLLEALQEAGQSDKTLILFVGDHGPPFFRGKTSCYEGGVRVPMLLVWPGVSGVQVRSQALVSTVDILPTLLDACELSVNVELQGKSLRQAITQDDFRTYLATEFHYHGRAPFFPRRSIRDARFKLIHNLRAGEVLPGSTIDGDPALKLARESQKTPDDVRQAFERAADPPEYELYDLQADPWEFIDLSQATEHQATLERMQAALMQWREETSDPLLDPTEYNKIAAYADRQPNEP